MTRSKKKSRKAEEARRYHHGDLRAALIEAGEVVLRRDGVAGLGMRTVTREAGVSHTAAKPHFGSLDGLRAEIAAKGFHKLSAACEATASIRARRPRRIAIARAYVHFAVANIALFELMFRHELIDMTQPALVEATGRAMRALAEPLADESRSEDLGRDGAIRIAAGWAFVHGLAVLVVEKRLRGVVKRAPAFSGLLELADAVVDHVSLRIET
jgi:AcrR family transcriptional regulator